MKTNSLPALPSRQWLAKVEPITVLAVTFILVPALGSRDNLIVQDTLKSAIGAMGVLLAAFVFFWQRHKHSAPWRVHGVMWFPLALMVYALGSMVWSHTYLAGVEAIRWFIVGLLLWLGLNTLNAANVGRLLWGIHWGAVVASIWTAGQFWWDWRIFPQVAVPGSSFLNRNFFAEYAISVLPLSVWLLTSVKQTRLLGIVALSVALQLLAIFMTGTRSALLALWVLLPTMGFVLFKYRKHLQWIHWSTPNRLLVGFVLVVGLVGLGNVTSSNPAIVPDATPLEIGSSRTASVAQESSNPEGTVSIRFRMWKSALRMLQDNPWLGVGAGAYEVHIPLYQSRDTLLEEDYYTHNDFLQWLCEYGAIVGGISIALLLAHLLQAATRLWNEVPQGSHALLPAGLQGAALSSMLALLLVSMSEFPLHLAACSLLFGVNLSFIFAPQTALLDVPNGHLQALARQMRTFAVVFVGSCIALASFITWQAVRAERLIFQSIGLLNSVYTLKDGEIGIARMLRAQAVLKIKEAISITPHYRKLVPLVAKSFQLQGDKATAAWRLERTLISRPWVAVLWAELVVNYVGANQNASIQAAFAQLKRLKPEHEVTRSLEVIVLNSIGRKHEATALLHQYFDQDRYNYDQVQTGLSMGIDNRDVKLAIRSLELLQKYWPLDVAAYQAKLQQIYSIELIEESRVQQ